MTADNDTPLLPQGEAASSENSAPAKKSPRRKVAVRPKVSAVAVVAEAENVSPEAAVKVRPTRRKKAVDEPLAAVDPATQGTPELLPAAAMGDLSAQPRVSSAPDLKESPLPESQVETKVIPPEVMEKIEEQTKKNFPHSHDAQDQVPARMENSTAPAQDAVTTGQSSPGAVQPADSATPPVAALDQPHAGDSDTAVGKPFENATPAEPPQPVAQDGRGANPHDGRGANPKEERRFEGSGQPFQGRRGDHRQHGRGDYPPRGSDHQQGRGDYQQGRGGQQGFRPQGGYQGGQAGPQPVQQPPRSGGGEAVVTRVIETQYGEGIIEVSGKGFGFLREAKRNFVQTPADIFVTPEVCREYRLRDGQWIKGEIRRSSRGPQLFRLTALNGEDPEKFRNLPNFDELTSINPKKRIKLETVSDRYTTRVMDLMTPIGKGQRGLIVAPPRTGKTTLLQHIAEAVVKNHTEMKLIILLVDERPEEVTEIRRSVPEAEIMASSNDSDLKSHTRIAQLAIERAKRLVEAGRDVFILLDSITRMARAFNNSMSGGGRGTASGGLAVGALEIPRKLFAAARNTEEAGSLTIMATALIETNSKMDDAIFQEFKGTGNMELVLDRKISDQRIYPAVDIFLSGTRREELLLQSWELDKINVIRRGLAGHKPIEAIERLLSFLKKFPTNTQMLASLPG